MSDNFLDLYRARVADDELKRDVAQEAAALRLAALGRALETYRPGRRGFFGGRKPPRGLYLWGDVGRGKSMLMDMFFAAAPTGSKLRIHFNAFMTETHARLHEWRELTLRARAARPEFVHDAGDDPIAPIAQRIAMQATLLCFDEFQVSDVADAMILGRLFQQLLARGVVIVATSNTPPRLLYQGGLNRQLFLPFIALIEERLDIVEVNGPHDYRLGHLTGLNIYNTPLGPAATAAMDAAWAKLSDRAAGGSETLIMFGRALVVPRTANGVARFSFEELCARPLAAADYLAIARRYRALLIDNIPVLGPENRNEARRFIVLVDTLYDTGTKLVCSAAAPPDRLYMSGDGAETFRRTASRLTEMQSLDYLRRVPEAHADTTEPILAGLA